MVQPVYLDYAATTPVDPRVVDKLNDFLGPDGLFANPGSTSHTLGHSAQQAVEQARAQVAELINADSREIVWTSGATEANNLALKGAARQLKSKGRHIVTCKSEHKAVLDPCRQLEREGFEVTYLDPDGSGRIELAALRQSLRSDTVLVSLMHVNNETGTVQDISAVGGLTRERGVLLHVDAAQGAGKLPLDVQTQQIDLVSINAHKIYGPKGIGALYARRRPKVRLQPLVHGGGQERGLRAGTLPTHQIAAMGEACRLARIEMAADADRIGALRDRLLAGLKTLPGIVVNGHSVHTSPYILNVSFAGVAGEALISNVMPRIAVATGSACTSATRESSHVLQAMGVDPLHADSAIRFSLGRFSSDADVDTAIAVVSETVVRLRAISPLWSDTEPAGQASNLR